ncbi:MAG: hypothetical protein FD168_2286 [Desulfobulbaceae bacterium]|nr:MAG: hypothetical protein FD168_2286 [Desulfobulbaceae bacterium]
MTNVSTLFTLSGADTLQSGPSILRICATVQLLPHLFSRFFYIIPSSILLYLLSLNSMLREETTFNLVFTLHGNFPEKVSKNNSSSLLMPYSNQRGIEYGET